MQGVGVRNHIGALYMPGKEWKMSKEYNVMRTTGVTGGAYSSVIGKKAPLNHPVNCNDECPYGYDKAFCFPCMKKIMEEHRAAKKK